MTHAIVQQSETLEPTWPEAAPSCPHVGLESAAASERNSWLHMHSPEQKKSPAPLVLGAGQCIWQFLQTTRSRKGKMSSSLLSPSCSAPPLIGHGEEEPTAGSAMLCADSVTACADTPGDAVRSGRCAADRCRLASRRRCSSLWGLRAFGDVEQCCRLAAAAAAAMNAGDDLDRFLTTKFCTMVVDAAQTIAP